MEYWSVNASHHAGGLPDSASNRRADAGAGAPSHKHSLHYHNKQALWAGFSNPANLTRKGITQES